MSKHVKHMMVESMAERLDGVTECLLVSLDGIDANENHRLRMALRGKDIELMVVKNSLIRLVFRRIGLAYMIDLMAGPTALVWGQAGIVELAKEISRWADDIERLVIKGGGMDGAALSVAEVNQLSKLPSREQLLGRLVSLATGPGARVSALATAPASAVLSQIRQIAEPEDEQASAEEGV